MNKRTAMTSEMKLGWILLGAGLLLFIVGASLRALLPGAVTSMRLVMTFGIFFGGWGLVTLAKYLAALRDPAAARRIAIEEKDERSVAIRRQAGYAGFTFSIIASSVGLLVYSALSQHNQGFDLMWWFLALLVVGPGLVYTILLVRLHSQS